MEFSLCFVAVRPFSLFVLAVCDCRARRIALRGTLVATAQGGRRTCATCLTTAQSNTFFLFFSFLSNHLLYFVYCTRLVLCRFAFAQGSIVVFDAAYAPFIRTPGVPKSIFEIEGARSCCIEVRRRTCCRGGGKGSEVRYVGKYNQILGFHEGYCTTVGRRT